MTHMSTHTRTCHQRHLAAQLVEPVLHSPALACQVQFCPPQAAVLTPWTDCAETLYSYSALGDGKERDVLASLTWCSSWKQLSWLPCHTLDFLSLLYLLQCSSEAVLGSHQVSFFPVLLPKYVPALNKAWLQLHRTGKALFCFGTEIRGHIQTSALLQQVLSSVFKLICWRGGTQSNGCCLMVIR